MFDENDLFIINERVLLRHISGVYVFVPVQAISGIKCDQFVLTNSVGAQIWNAFERPTSIKQVIQSLSRAYSVQTDLLQRDIYGMVSSFLKLGILIEVASDGLY